MGGACPSRASIPTEVLFLPTEALEPVYAVGDARERGL